MASSHSTRSGESSEVYGLDRLSKSEGGSATAYAYDGRGSVAQTLSASGTVSSWHMWGAFGSQEAGSALGELPSYGYNAEEAHPQTGLQYLRARYYDAESGRFGVQDSYLGQLADPLSLNRYLYCLSDPLNWIDSDGHLPRPTNYRVHDHSRSNRTGPLGSSVIDVSRMKSAGSILSGVAGRLSPSAWVSFSSAMKVSVSLKSRGNVSQANAWRAKAQHYRSIVTKYYCGNAEQMRVSKQAKLGIAFPEGLHTALQVAGYVVPIIADWADGALYRIEGKYEESSEAFVNALVDAYTLGYGKKGKLVATGAEIIWGAKKGVKTLTKAEKMSMTAEEIIAIEKSSGVSTRFPGQWKHATLAEIERAAKSGDKDAKTAYKILTNNRFNKGDNRK